MEAGELGKTYQDGEIIVREGEAGDRMYVVQTGRVAVTRRLNGHDVFIAELGAQDVFGEMALFERDSRSATVRAIGTVRVLSVDKKAFLRRVHEDPSLAYRILQQMSRRIREADVELARLKLSVDGDKAGEVQRAPQRTSRLRKRVDILKYFLAGLRRSGVAKGEHAHRERRKSERRKKERRNGDRRKGERRRTASAVGA